MESLITQNYREISFIKIFFRILLAFFLMAVICILVFDINDSVTFSTGEIVAEVPQIDFKAPFEGIPVKVFVKEGQSVKKGDTLMILSNESVSKSYQDAQSNYEALRTGNDAIEGLILNAQEKIQILKREREIARKTYNSEKDQKKNTLELAGEKAKLNKEKLDAVALSKLKTDSILFREQVISALDLTNSFDSYLNYKNSVIESEEARDEAEAALNTLAIDYLQKQNALDLKLVELNERIKELTKEKAESAKDLKTAEENLDFNQAEAAKQYIISDRDGEVLNLHNQKFTQNFINKGDLLLSVVPPKDTFYAKVVIPQRDIRKIRVGQQAHLKVEAFPFFDKGILKGKVSYVPERKPKDEEFFVIIDLSSTGEFQLKSGYSLRGEVIIENLKIYQYILKKLFRKLEDASMQA